MKVFLALLGIGFTGLIFWALSIKPLGESLEYIAADPWGVVTLADLYLGFILFMFFIFKTSISKIKAVVWSASLLVLGNVIAVIYLILYLNQVVKRKESKI